MTDTPRKLFGTDGIRGVANEWPLTPEFIVRIGTAIGQALGSEAAPALALIGRDTRQSGLMIENALAAGLMSQGLPTLHIGVLTTPGIAYLTRTLGARCGISISASHNPYRDNGIKVFGPDGFKIPDALEGEIERLAQTLGQSSSATVGSRRDGEHYVELYANFVLDAVKREKVLAGKRIVVDCNNGATFALAPRLLSDLGAHVLLLNHEPDGVNINRGYDALEPARLRETVLRERADLGVQFDGDGDRAVFVDERGNYVDGDFVLAILARDFVSRGALQLKTVVTTVMANIGLEQSLAEIGVTLERTAVGDRWVTEAMRANGAPIGGEQSGHIVLFDGGHTTGDGLYTAVRLADVLARRSESLSSAAACMRRYPQILINIPVSHKPPLDEILPVQSQLERSRTALGDGSRILLRYSGTENLARVMIEGSDAAEIEREAHAIAATIREAIA